MQNYFQSNIIQKPTPKNVSTAAIMIACHGLSVNDSFWTTENPNDKWADYNIKENPLNDVIKKIALLGVDLPAPKGKLVTPEGTTNGSQAKCWDREDDGILYLYKASFQNHEAEKEVMVSNILDCTNIPHVKYVLSEKDGVTVSRCENLYEKTGMFVVSANSVISKCNFTDESFSKLIMKDKNAIASSCHISVVSYLISDRDVGQEKNVLMYIDAQSGKYKGVAPLSDFGDSFNEEIDHDKSLPNCLRLNTTGFAKEDAINAIKYLESHGNPIKFTKPITRDMFLTEKMYESFCSKAVELGLMKHKTLNKNEIKAISMGKKVDKYEITVDMDNKHETDTKKNGNTDTDEFDTNDKVKQSQANALRGAMSEMIGDAARGPQTLRA